MKLKEILELISDNYEVGLADYDRGLCIISIYKKEDVVSGFAQKANMTDDQILNMKVVAVHAGAKACLATGVEMFGDDSAELHIKTQILIEVSSEEKEDD